MAAKVAKFDDVWVFYCLGCKKPHPFDERWQFNGDQDKPTFTPSLLGERHEYPPGNIRQQRCHLFVTDGKIRYLSDCDHDLAGTTVYMIDWDHEEHF